MCVCVHVNVLPVHTLNAERTMTIGKFLLCFAASSKGVIVVCLNCGKISFLFDFLIVVLDTIYLCGAKCLRQYFVVVASSVLFSAAVQSKNAPAERFSVRIK